MNINKEYFDKRLQFMRGKVKGKMRVAPLSYVGSSDLFFPDGVKRPFCPSLKG